MVDRGSGHAVCDFPPAAREPVPFVRATSLRIRLSLGDHSSSDDQRSVFAITAGGGAEEMRHVAKRMGITEMNSHGPLVVQNACISSALTMPQERWMIAR